MNDVESNNDTNSIEEFIGMRVRILDGYGKGRLGYLLGTTEGIPQNVDLRVDDDEMGADSVRRNYNPGSWELVQDENSTDTVEEMLAPPRGTVLVGTGANDGAYFLVDARHDETVLMYRIDKESDGAWRFFNSNAPIDKPAAEAAGMAWANPQPSTSELVTMAMTLAENRRREITLFRDKWQSAQAEHQSFVETVTAAAHEYANENRLCEEFDDFMIEHGMEPRERTWTVEVEATIRVTVEVKAKNEGDARDLAVTESADGDYEGLDSAIIGRIRQESYDHEVLEITQG